MRKSIAALSVLVAFGAAVPAYADDGSTDQGVIAWLLDGLGLGGGVVHPNGGTNIGDGT